MWLLRVVKIDFFKSLLLLPALTCLSSCQYQFGRGDLSERYATISIPYAQGDLRGDLTAEVIRKLSSSGSFRYVNAGGDLLLQIKLIDASEENIGFRYDRKKSGKLKHSIIPTETRVNAVAEVSLIEAGTEKVVRGPVRITADAEFDHTYDTTRDRINVFSLGQLSDIDAARDAAMVPLNRALAERIVDFVMNSW